MSLSPLPALSQDCVVGGWAMAGEADRAVAHPRAKTVYSAGFARASVHHILSLAACAPIGNVTHCEHSDEAPSVLTLGVHVALG